MDDLRKASVDKFPEVPSVPGGTILETLGGWRTLRPIYDPEKCTKCFLCWIYCPEGAIKKMEDRIKIDYDYCKGCGICARECKFDAITMVREEKEKDGDMK